ncbi:MAG: hypothetical protein AB7P08_04690 [Burkholderiales bacterium]
MLKITGLVLILISVAQLPGYIPLTGRGYEFSFGEVLTTAAVGIGPLVLIGLGLWFFPGTAANKIVAGAPTDSPISDTHSLQLIALTIVGVYLVADGLIGAVRSTVLLIVMYRQADVAPPIPASVIAHAAATLVELLIGVSLCVGAKGVSRAIERFRQ